MANGNKGRIMKILFQLQGQIDGSVGNSFSAMTQKTAAVSKEIKELKRNLLLTR